MMTEQFERWLEHQFPGFEYDDIVDCIDSLDKLDILTAGHTMQALRDRYEDACEAEYWDQGDYCRERLADIAQWNRERAQEMNKR